jgi:DNA primase
MDNQRNVPEEIKDRLPIDQLVGSYVPLKKAGRIYKGLCPFHNEKTPSFTVNPDRGIFKCFGCGKGGDIFDFICEIEGLTFGEAMVLLADKTGVVLPERKPGERAQQSSGKARLFELNEFIASFWHKILVEHPKAEPARAYLKKRGITNESIRQFRIGYAPYGDATSAALQKRQFSRQDIQLAGDPAKFRDRIVFPICDLTGKVVGFTGRLLELPDDPKGGSSRGPKYWNTPETPVFIKSKAVYALHLAKHAIQKEELALLAEGQMDVVALHQAGYTTAVASSGTALTPEQLAFIGRFASTVVFAYDSDSAGKEATRRGIELALAAELTPYVIAMPGGKDPADCLQKDPTIWKHAYETRQPFMEWLLDEALAGHSATSLPPEKKKGIAVQMAHWLARLQDITEQDSWIPVVAARLQTDEKNIRTLLQKLHPERPVAVQRQERVEQPTSHVSTLAERVLAILFTFPEAYTAIKPQLATLRLVPETPYIAKLLPILEKADGSFEQELQKKLSDEERKNLALVTEELLQPYGEIELSAPWAVTELSLILQRVRSDARASEKQRIADEIARAQALGDGEKVRTLFQELQNLI